MGHRFTPIKTDIIQVRCTAQEKAALIAFAEREGRSLTSAVITLIRKADAEHKSK